MGFEVIAIALHPENESLLLVSGLKDLVALTLGTRGEVISRLVVDLLLDSLGFSLPAHILKAGWMPGSTSACFVVTNHFVKIYDLAIDKLSPVHAFHVIDDSIKDVAFVHVDLPHCAPASTPPRAALPYRGTSSLSPLTMLALSASGSLFSQPLVLRDATCPDAGSIILTNALRIPAELRGRVGAALHYSGPTALLFTVYADGRCFALRLANAADDVVGGFAVHSSRVDNLASGALSGSKSVCVPYSHWQDVPGQRGMLVASCRKTQIPLALRVTPTSVEVQVLKSSIKAEGLATALASRRSVAATNEAISTQRPFASVCSEGSPSACWVLHEDGSLHCHTCGVATDSDGTLLAALTRAVAARPPPPAVPAHLPDRTFPVDFFERGSCVTSTAEITFAGDVVHNSTPTNAKARLSSNTDDYISSPHKASMSLEIHNANPDHVLIGVRLLLGSAHPTHVPASFTLFGRKIQTQEGQRRWYDVPLHEAESLVAARHLTITFSATHSAINMPVVDAVEVYAQSKADFGWDAAILRASQTYALTTLTPAASRLVKPPVDKVEESEPASSILRALQCSLRQLASFHVVSGSSSSSGSGLLVQEMIGSLPDVLTSHPACVSLRTPAKQLLRQLLPSQDDYLRVKDEATLKHAACAFGRKGSPGSTHRDGDRGRDAGANVEALVCDPEVMTSIQTPLTVGALTKHINSIHKVARKRPQNLFRFLHAHEPQLLTRLVHAFCSLQSTAARLNKLSKLTKALVSLLFTAAEQRANIAYDDHTQAFRDAAPDATSFQVSLEASAPYVDLLATLLLHATEAVRFMTSSLLGSLLLAPTAASTAAASDSTSAPSVVPPDRSSRQGEGRLAGSVLAAAASARNAITAAARRPGLRAADAERHNSSSRADASMGVIRISGVSMGLPSSTGMAIGGEEVSMELDDADTAEEAMLGIAVAGVANDAASVSGGGVQFCCDVCGACPIVDLRWHCETCRDFDLCAACYEDDTGALPHPADHHMVRIELTQTNEDTANAVGTVPITAVAAAAPVAVATGPIAGGGGSADSENEDVMLAMAVAMSLGNEASEACTPSVAEAAADDTAAAALSSSPAAPDDTSTAAIRPRVRMAALVFSLMTKQLNRLGVLDGMSCLPYLQLLHRLAMHRDVAPVGGGPGWQHLADEVLALLLPRSAPFGSATPDSMAAGAPAATVLSYTTRSAALEVRVLLLLLLTLLLTRISSASTAAPTAKASALRADTTPDTFVAEPATEDMYHAPGQRESLKAMQRELAAHLCSHGLPETLFADAQRFYAYLWEAASLDGNVAPGSSGNVTSSSGSKCSGLLTVRERPPEARSLTPFFTEELSKASADPFSEIHRIGLDALLRLAQRLHSPLVAPDATGAAGSVAQPALGGAVDSNAPLGHRWIKLLCSIIHSSAFNFARKQAKKHLLQLCGTKSRYLEVRDRGLADAEMHCIRLLLTEHSALPEMAEDGIGLVPSIEAFGSAQPLPYEQHVKLCTSLQRLQEMATAQPRNWIRYCATSAASSDGTLCMLTHALFQLHGEGLLATLRLLAAGLRDETTLPPLDDGPSVANFSSPTSAATLAVSVPTTATSDGADPAAFVNYPVRASESLAIDLNTLLKTTSIERFVTCFLLQGSSAAIRVEGCGVFRCVWTRASSEQRTVLFRALRSQLRDLPLYGANSHEIMVLLGSLMAADDLDVSMVTLTLETLLGHLSAQTTLLTQHPNAHVYNVLGSLLELDGHFLEVEPLHASNQPDLPSQQVGHRRRVECSHARAP